MLRHEIGELIDLDVQRDELHVEVRHRSLQTQIQLWCQEHKLAYTEAVGMATRGWGLSFYLCFPKADLPRVLELTTYFFDALKRTRG